MGKLLKIQNQKLALRADSGLSIGTIYPLVSKRNILGRSVEVEVPVDDTKVSRIHASIDEQNGFYYIVDLGSTNGTYLNSEKVQHSLRINPGDQIRLGSTVYIVEFLDYAKSLCGKTWKEPTRAIMFDQQERAKLSAPSKEDGDELNESSLDRELFSDKVRDLSNVWIKKYSQSRDCFLDRNGKMFSVITMVMLIAAAIATTFV